MKGSVDKHLIPDAVDEGMRYLGQNSWFIRGAREAAIDRAMYQEGLEPTLHAISSALHEHRIIWPATDDPCDEVTIR